VTTELYLPDTSEAQNMPDNIRIPL